MKNGENPISPINKLDATLQYGIGLTKREYFALHLMQGLISNADRHSQQGDCESWNYQHLSEIAIKASDELLKQLEQ